MYAPEPFGVSDKAIIGEFLREHTFGTLITTGKDGVPIATHLPFLFKEIEGEWYLESHLAKANPQEALLQDGSAALIVISGASGYVSSSVYTHVNVPTYNYEAVHLTGRVERLSDEALMAQLRSIVANYEQGRRHPIDFDTWPVEMIAGYLQEITGFRVKAEKVEAAFKLSQNRNEIDFERIVTDLNKGSVTQQLLAEAMRKRRKS